MDQQAEKGEQGGRKGREVHDWDIYVRGTEIDKKLMNGLNYDDLTVKFGSSIMKLEEKSLKLFRKEFRTKNMREIRKSLKNNGFISICLDHLEPAWSVFRDIKIIISNLKKLIKKNYTFYEDQKIHISRERHDIITFCKFEKVELFWLLASARHFSSITLDRCSLSEDNFSKQISQLKTADFSDSMILDITFTVEPGSPSEIYEYAEKLTTWITPILASPISSSLRCINYHIRFPYFYSEGDEWGEEVDIILDEQQRFFPEMEGVTETQDGGDATVWCVQLRVEGVDEE